MCWLPLDDIITCTAPADCYHKLLPVYSPWLSFFPKAQGTVALGAWWGLSAGISVDQIRYMEGGGCTYIQFDQQDQVGQMVNTQFLTVGCLLCDQSSSGKH